MTDAVMVALIASVPASGAVILGFINRRNLGDVKKSVDGTQTAILLKLTELTEVAGYRKGVIDKWEQIEARNDLLAATPPVSQKK